MGGEWKPTRLGDHITLKGGLSYKGEFVDKGDALLIGMGCVSHTERFLHKGGRQYGGDFNEAHLVRPGDLVIATRQQSDNLPILGFPAMIPEDLRGRNVVAATNLYKVTNHSEISNRFLYWLMRSPAYRERILGCAKGSTVRMLTKDAIEDFDFLCPPEEEREAIAEILDTLVDKIELNRHMNETLEAIARAIFKSWFVDFDPVRAKVSGEAPESICRRLRLTPDLLALFPDRLVDSELGEIPKGWEVKPLPTTIDVNPTRALRKGTVAPYLDMANMPTTSARALSIVGREFGSGMKFENGDTLVARITPCLENGKTCFVDFLNDAQVGWGSTEYIVLRPKRPLPDEFAYFLARTDAFRSHAIANMTGTSGRQRVPSAAFDGFSLVVPEAQLAAEFGRLARSAIATMRASDAESGTLSAIRDALLPKLLSGELRVPEIESLQEAMT